MELLYGLCYVFVCVGLLVFELVGVDGDGVCIDLLVYCGFEFVVVYVVEGLGEGGCSGYG